MIICIDCLGKHYSHDAQFNELDLRHETDVPLMNDCNKDLGLKHDTAVRPPAPETSISQLYDL